MAHILADRVQETSTTTGTGTLNLDGAVSKFRTFVAGIGSSNTVDYVIVHRSAAEWEVGIGTVTDASPDTLSRTTVLSSSNAGALVDLSAGTKDVYCSFSSAGVPQGRGFIDGFQMSNATDTDHDILVGIGEARDSQNILTIRGSQMTKQIDASWAVGTAAGGMFTGSVGNSTWYHVHAIRKDSDGTVDYGFDTSVTAANKPAGYSYYRRVGSVLTNGSANITQFFQVGNEFRWKSFAALDGSGTLSTSETLATLAVPPDVNVIAEFRWQVDLASGGAVVTARYPSTTNITPAVSAAPLADIMGSAAGVGYAVRSRVLTNTSRQVALTASAASTNYYYITTGYHDFRGRQ